MSTKTSKYRIIKIDLNWMVYEIRIYRDISIYKMADRTKLARRPCYGTIIQPKNNYD